ncbi:hypothetical protein G6011_06966 [Alternaria panax]|uniref:SMP domain-containing protein n=1 Tax=Alternaria panax TaxID=48097 RepID=A0AAD4F963_9PLEO|nr:hypothetical protein G6011_06966 [Alternaria panax]
MPSSNQNANTSGGNKASTPMGKSDAGRIQSTQVKSGGDMSSGRFAARAQGAGDRNTNTSGQQDAGEKKGEDIQHTTSGNYNG